MLVNPDYTAQSLTVWGEFLLWVCFLESSSIGLLCLRNDAIIFKKIKLAHIAYVHSFPRLWDSLISQSKATVQPAKQIHTVRTGFCTDKRSEDTRKQSDWKGTHCWVSLDFGWISKKTVKWREKKTENTAKGKRQMGRKGKFITCSWIFPILF